MKPSTGRRGEWCSYASRQCSGKVAGRLYQRISDETKVGHRRWALHRWSARHADLRTALARFKAGQIDLMTMARSLVLVEQRAYQRGWAQGKREARKAQAA